MKFVVVIHASPCSSGSKTALEFCRAALISGHHLPLIFFYRDGVHNLTRLNIVQSNELDLPRQWDDLISCYGLKAIACASSALKRGVIDEKEAQRWDRNAANLTSNALIGGLGQLVDACETADRILNFG